MASVTESEDAEDVSKLESLPPYLQSLADQLRAKEESKPMSRVILALCHWKELKALEIAGYCNRRNVAHVRTYFEPLIDADCFTVTGNKNSPHVKYKTTALGFEWLLEDDSGGLPPTE